MTGAADGGGRARPLILATLLLCTFVINADVTLINVTLPTLVEELDASTRSLQWIVDAYTLVFASLVLAAGALSDRYGRKGMLLAGLGIYTGGSLAAGFADSSDALIALRAATGLGAAMIFPSTLSILTNVYTERHARAKAIGAWGATAGAAVALGPIVGGACLEQWSWQAAFVIKAPVAVLAAVAVLLLVPTSRDPAARRIDVGGVVLSVLAVLAVVYAIIEAPSRGWLSAQISGLLALGAFLAGAWALWERRTATPMFDLRVLRDPRFAAASSAITFAFFALAGFTFLITQYFQFLQGYTPLGAGVRVLPVAISVAVASILGARLAVRAGVGRVVPVGLGLLALAYLWISTADETTTYQVIAGQMVVLGTGMGLTSAPATDSLMSAASNAVAGVASAINDTTRELGSTLGVAIIGSVFNSLYRSHLDGTDRSTLPGAALAAAHDSVGAAFAAADRLDRIGQAQAGDRLREIATDGFISGQKVACYVAAGVCAAGALGVALALRHAGARAPRTDSPPRRVWPSHRAGLAAAFAAGVIVTAPVVLLIGDGGEERASAAPLQPIAVPTRFPTLGTRPAFATTANPHRSAPQLVVGGPGGWCLRVPDPAAPRPGGRRSVSCISDREFRRIGIALTVSDQYVAAIPRGLPDPQLRRTDGSTQALHPDAHGLVVVDPLPAGHTVVRTDARGQTQTDHGAPR